MLNFVETFFQNSLFFPGQLGVVNHLDPFLYDLSKPLIVLEIIQDRIIGGSVVDILVESSSSAKLLPLLHHHLGSHVGASETARTDLQNPSF